ncbi:MAG: hypothetical protein MI808_13390 [Pseudomonadales bacterium]|nr:hypothetical protein [Pseudomonadales bacterium]
MLIALLTFSQNKAQAATYMDGHNQWLKQGFDEGVFLLAGSLTPKQGGAVIAHDISKAAFEKRVSEDPFVQHNVVNAEILEIAPAKVSNALLFLMPEETPTSV